MPRTAMLLFLLAIATLFAGSKSAAQDAPEDSPETESSDQPAESELTPELVRRLGELLREDWKDRPEWAEMAIPLLTGDLEMGMGRGWYKPSQKRYYWSWIRENFDANKDRKVTADEFAPDAPYGEQFFARLDRNADGKIEPRDFDWSSFSSYRMRKNMSNGVFSRLDFDSNGRLTEEEMLHFFRTADRDDLGFVTPDDLLIVLDPPDPTAQRSSEPPTEEDSFMWLRMLLDGDLGSLTSGPDLDEKAPDFTLPLHDGKAEIRLTELVGEKPVVLVFGSFT